MSGISGRDGPIAGDGGVTAAEAAERALSAQEGGPPVALVTLIAAPESDRIGRRLVVTADARTGSLGSAELDADVTRLAREVLAARGRGVYELEHQGATWAVYIESQHARPELLIVGAGHIGQALCRLGGLLGFRVTVIDDRREFATRERFPEAERVLVVDFAAAFKDVSVGRDSYVVLVTRGHKYDFDCIVQLLNMDTKPNYLGMIGSRRRVRATFEALLRDGITPERLADVRAPIGLDIGAETPEEIALAIAAEIVACRRGRSGGALSAQEEVLARVARKRESQKPDPHTPRDTGVARGEDSSA